MSIDWKSLGHAYNIAYLLRATYRPLGGGGDQTLYFCHASGPGEDGFWDHENSRLYSPYLLAFSTDERWNKIVPRPKQVAELLTLTLALPPDMPAATKAAVLQGSFRRRTVVLEAVQTDGNGLVLAREEIWRGVGADRGTKDTKVTGPNSQARTSTTTLRCEGMQGLMSLEIPLDSWIVTSDKADYSGQDTFLGNKIPRVYAESWNVATNPSTDTDGGNWIEVPIIESTSALFLAGICGHDIDENPNSGGSWLTSNTGGFAQAADFTSGGWSVTGWGSFTVTGTWPKLVSTYSQFGSDAMVVDMTAPGPTRVKGRQAYANIHGVGSAAGGSNAIVQVELVAEDLLTFCGASGFWYDGWPAALGTTVSAANRTIVSVLPGVRPSPKAPILQEVIGEYMGLFGLNFIWAVDSANNDELRYKLAYRETPTAPYDHRVEQASGVCEGISIDLADTEDPTDMSMRSAPFFRALWVNDNGETHTTTQTYNVSDSTAKTVDNTTKRVVHQYKWVRSGDATSFANADTRWDTVAAITLDHTASRVQTVRGTMGTYGMAIQRGDSVDWVFDLVDYLDNGSAGLVARRAVSVSERGDLRVDITTIHGPFSY